MTKTVSISMTKTVNILGTPYEVNLKVPYDSDPNLQNRMGYCEVYGKKIVVADHKTIPSWETENEDAVLAGENASLRHEITHAFFFESGLWGASHDVTAWGCDEEMTDWIALQLPKIVAVCKELECL